MERIWPWAEAEDLDRRSALADEIGAAITSVLTALGEPLYLRSPCLYPPTRRQGAGTRVGA